MQDFNSYASKNHQKNSGYENLNPDLYNMVTNLASKFDGKNQTELLKAIYEQAKRGKQNGTLSNAEIDSFCQMLLPLVDEKQKKLLKKVCDDLKKI